MVECIFTNFFWRNELLIRIKDNITINFKETVNTIYERCAHAVKHNRQRDGQHKEPREYGKAWSKICGMPRSHTTCVYLQCSIVSDFLNPMPFPYNCTSTCLNIILLKITVLFLPIPVFLSQLFENWFQHNQNWMHNEMGYPQNWSARLTGTERLTLSM